MAARRSHGFAPAALAVLLNLVAAAGCEDPPRPDKRCSVPSGTMLAICTTEVDGICHEGVLQCENGDFICIPGDRPCHTLDGGTPDGPESSDLRPSPDLQILLDQSATPPDSTPDDSPPPDLQSPPDRASPSDPVTPLEWPKPSDLTTHSDLALPLVIDTSGCKETLLPPNMAPYPSSGQCPGGPDSSPDGGTCIVPTCSAPGGNVLGMKFDPQYGWNVCVFRKAVDLSTFDVEDTSMILDAGTPTSGSGVLVVTLCVSGGPLDGQVRLYYGRYPHRKYLALVGSEQKACEKSLSFTGCKMCFFQPKDALRDPNWPKVNGLYQGGPECGKDGCACTDGGVCNFASVDVSLISENTSADAGAITTVTLRGLAYYREQCKCLADGDCPSSLPSCALPAMPAGPLPAPFCPGDGGCAGVCKVRCNQPCSALIGNQRCEGHWDCDRMGCDLGPMLNCQ